MEIEKKGSQTVNNMKKIAKTFEKKLTAFSCIIYIHIIYNSRKTFKRE